MFIFSLELIHGGPQSLVGAQLLQGLLGLFHLPQLLPFQLTGLTLVGQPSDRPLSCFNLPLVPELERCPTVACLVDLPAVHELFHPFHSLVHVRQSPGQWWKSKRISHPWSLACLFAPSL